MGRSVSMHFLPFSFLLQSHLYLGSSESASLGLRTPVPSKSQFLSLQNRRTHLPDINSTRISQPCLNHRGFRCTQKSHDLPPPSTCPRQCILQMFPPIKKILCHVVLYKNIVLSNKIQIQYLYKHNVCPCYSNSGKIYLTPVSFESH